MRRVVLALCAVVAIATGGASAAAGARLMPGTPQTAQLNATNCGIKWADFYGEDWLQSRVTITFQISACSNGSSVWLTPAYLSLSGRNGLWAVQASYRDNDGYRWWMVDSSHAGYYGSAPIHFWANVYVGKDWLGVQKWFYPRAELSANGTLTCRDGGGSYWGLRIASCG